MTLLEKYNEQEALLKNLGEQYSILIKILKALEEKRREIICELIADYDVLTESLEQIGICEFKYIGQVNCTEEMISGRIFHKGIIKDVMLGRDTGNLLIEAL